MKPENSTDDRIDSPKIAVSPAILFFGCLIIGYLLDIFFPLKRISWPWLPGVGAGLFVLSFIIGGWAFLLFHRQGTPVEPSKPTVSLVKTGPYRISRNPLYIALLLFFTGMSIIVNSIWLFLMIPVLFSMLHFGVVIPEENYLTQKFGDEYQSYRKQVRRWI